MKDLGRKLLLSAGALALVLAVAEVALRLFVGTPPRGNITPVPSSIREASGLPGLPYVLRRGSEVVHRFPSDPRRYFDPDATLSYRINALGFRGPETTLRKPAGVFRIVGVGDSFTFGTGVRVGDTFLAELERLLADAGGSRRFEVLNLGVMGFNTVNEVALLRAKGLDLEPDLVVVCFFLNDAQGGPTHALFNVAARGEGLASLARYSVLLDRILWTLERRHQSQELAKSYRRSFAADAPGWIHAQRALDAAAGLARREEFELVLMIFPVLWQLSEDYPFREVHAIVGSFAMSRAIPVLDLLPAFADLEGPELWVHPTNQHPNETAHAIAGEALFEFLQERGMLPATGPRER